MKEEKNLALYTKNYSSFVLHINNITLDKFRLESGFFHKVDLFEKKRVEPKPITYEGREEMMEVLNKCYKIKTRNVRPNRDLLIDHNIKAKWETEEKWEYDFTRPINKPKDIEHVMRKN